jgi:hypothetical protein
MSNGSSLFSNQGPAQGRFIEGKGGVAGEVSDLRHDVAGALALLAAITVQEFTNPLAAAANNMMAATTSQTTEDVLLPAVTPAAGALTQATIDNLGTGGPRQLVFTVGGGTPAHRAPSATIYGVGADGRKRVQVLGLPDVAGTATSNFFIDIEKVVLAAGSGAGATVAIGLGALLGLGAPVVSRAGRAAVLQEVAAGSVVTNGAVLEDVQSAATVTGSADLSTGGTLATETLIVEVDGGAAQTVTFATPANTAAVVAAVEAVIPGIASDDGSDHLVLTSPTTGPDSTLKITGTALTKLGITTGVYQGTDTGYGTYAPNSAPNGSTSYALYYEFDPNDLML